MSTDNKTDVNVKTDSSSRPEYGDLFFLPPPIASSYDTQETMSQRMIRKTKQNPFVPLGVAFTTVVLALGLGTMVTGKSQKTQMFMRLRVAGQAFAVYAIVAGVYYNTKLRKNQ